MQLEMILPHRAYGFFSHTHKAQKENMPLLDEVATIFLYPCFPLTDTIIFCGGTKLLGHILRSLKKEYPCLIMS